MSSRDEEWWTLRAAEYVLGTLRGTDLELFQRILANDTEVQGSVAAWENRLYPLNASTAPVNPPARVWPKIASAVSRLNGAGAAGATAPGAVRTDDPKGGSDSRPGADVPSIESVRRGRRTPTAVWPVVAMLATAASLLMAVLLNQALQRTGAPATGLEAAPNFTSDGTSIVSDEDGNPLWLVQTDHVIGLLRVTALDPPEAGSSESYQLWQVLPDGEGVASVGLLPDTEGEVQDYVETAFEFGADAFAVSLEPSEGSPEDVPSGPVLYDGPYQATNTDDDSE